jgi:hypothetical protein
MKPYHKPIQARRGLRALGLSLIVLLALLSSSVLPTGAAKTSPYADQLSEDQVQRAVETWVRQVTADARPEAVVEWMEPYYADAESGDSFLAGYVAHLEGGGFCLASASRLLLPVYLYVPYGTYDPDEAGFRDVLWEMGTRLEYLRRNLELPEADMSMEMQTFLPELPERSATWDALMAGQVPAQEIPTGLSSVPTLIELPFTSQWNQSSPYNDQCPNLTPGVDERTLTGCGATALAQVLYYWKWPATGIGSSSVDYTTHWRTTWDSEPLAANPNIPAGWTNRLEWTSTSGGLLRMNGYWDNSLYEVAKRINADAAYLAALSALWDRMATSTQTVSANFGLSTYNWSAMQDTHTDPVDDGDADVSQLMLQVGVASNMVYGVRASGSVLYQADDGLVNYLRYDSDVIYGHPDDDPNQTLYVDEIQWLRPVPYCASSPTDAHIWVITGYNQNTSPWQYKMNMGWGGSNNGWYTLDSAPLGLVNYRCHLVDLAPNSMTRFVGAATAGDGSPLNPYQNIEAALASVPDGSTLIFKAGSVNTFSAATLTINRPMTLKGSDATISK